MAVRGKITEFFALEEFEAQKKAVMEGVASYIDLVNKAKPIRVELKGAENIRPIVAGVKELNDNSVKLAANTTKVIETQRELDKAIMEGKVQKQQYNKELKTEIELQNSVTGSIAKAKAEVKALTAERDKLNLSTEEGRRRQLEINAQIDKNTDFIKENSAALEKQRLNVGNYANSLADGFEKVRSEIEKLRQKQEGLQKLQKADPIGFKLTAQSKELQQTTQALSQLESVVKIGEDENITYAQSVRKIGFAWQDMEKSGNFSREFLDEFKKFAAQAKDSAEDLRQEIKALASDTRGLDLFASGLNTVVNAGQAAFAANELFGSSNEEVQKSIQRLIAVQQIANGVKQVATDLTTKGSAANKLFAFVQGLVATSMDKTATSATRLKASLGLIGIIVTVIGAAVVAYTLFSNKLTETEKQQKRLNDVMGEAKSSYVSAVTLVKELGSEIQAAKDGFIKKSDVVKHYNETIGKTTGQVKNLDEAERQLTKNADAYIKFTLLKASANIAAEKAAEVAFKRQEKINEKLGSVDFITTSQEGYTQALAASKEFNEAQEKQNDLFLKGEFEKAKEQELIADRIKKQIRESLIAPDLLKEQQGFEKIFTDLFGQVQKLSKDFKFDFFGNEDDQNDLKERARKAVLDRLVTLQQINADNAKAILDDEKRGLSERLQALDDYLKARQNIIELNFDFEKTKTGVIAEEVVALEAKKTKEINDLNREGNKSLDAILSQQPVKQQEIIRTTIEQTSGLYKEQTGQLSSFLKNKEQLEGRSEKELRKARKQAIKDRLKDDEEYQQKKKELEKQLVSELTSLSFTLLTASIERQKNELQQQADAIEERKAREIELVNQTVTNEKDKAAAIAVIEARAQAQKEQIQRKQKELDIKKAQFDKAQAIARIIQETAIAVVTALKTPALIPLILAIGAAQLAAVVARPIPRYAEGTDDHPGGKFIAGDAGKKELVVTPDGRSFVTASIPTIYDAPQHSIVLPDADAVMRAAYHSTMSTPAAADKKYFQHQEMTNEIKKMRKDVVRAISKIPQPQIEVMNPLKRRIKYGDSSNEYLNKNLQG